MPISASDIKFVRSLQQKKFRQEHGLFVVEGIKPVQELIASELEIETVYATSDAEVIGSVAEIVTISKKELERISGLKTPNKVLATARVPINADIHWQAPLLLALDGISDPGNLGTIIRTAKWFGLNQIICSEDCVDAYDRKVVQSTMGALFHTDIIYTNLTETLSSASERGFRIVGAAMNGSSVYTMDSDQKTVLVIGSESHGISPTVLNACAETFTIPNRETDRSVESLNAGIATAIFLSELTRNR